MIIARIRKSSVGLAVLCLSLGLAASDVVAADDADTRLQTLTVALKQQDVADTHHAATAEIGKAEALKDKARTLVGHRRERDVLARTLDELEATLSLIEAKVLHAQAKAELEAAEARRDEVRAELATVRRDADALERQQAALEKKLGGAK